MLHRDTSGEGQREERALLDRRALSAGIAGVAVATLVAVALLGAPSVEAASTAEEHANLGTVKEFLEAIEEAVAEKSVEHIEDMLTEDAVFRYQVTGETDAQIADRESRGLPSGGEIEGRSEIMKFLEEILPPLKSAEMTVRREEALGPFVVHERLEKIEDDDGVRYIWNSAMFLIRGGKIEQWFELVEEGVQPGDR